MHFLQAINSDVSVLVVCNKTGGTIKGDKKIHGTGDQDNVTPVIWLIISSNASRTYGPGSVVVIAIGYSLDGPGIESWWGRDFSHLS